MSGFTIIAAALPLLFGLVIAGMAISDRRQTMLHRQIHHSIGTYFASAAASNLPLDSATRENMLPVLRWLPLTLTKKFQIAVGATGDRIALWHLLLAAGVSGALIFLLTERVLSLSLIYCVPIALAATLAAPVVLLRAAQARFRKVFLNSFPDALDLMVRAVRAGLPLADAVETIGVEIPGPVGAEFRRVRDGMTIGLEFEEALQRVAERVRAIEFRFFNVALSLQRRTGGNLAETLENLSLTIRQRKEMALKAKALMSESLASAWLIGLLPFLSGGAIYVLNPGYIQVLFDDPRGQTILGIAMVTLAIGAFIIRTMIKGAMR